MRSALLSIVTVVTLGCATAPPDPGTGDDPGAVGQGGGSSQPPSFGHGAAPAHGGSLGQAGTGQLPGAGGTTGKAGSAPTPGGKGGSAPTPAGQGGSGQSGGAGGAPPVPPAPSKNVCKPLSPGDCNPVLTTPCGGQGSACDFGDTGGFTCYDPPNSLQVGDSCSSNGPDFCSAGATCSNGTCTRFCCVDADCAGGTCVAQAGTVVGLCDNAAPPPDPTGAGGSGASGAGAGPNGTGAGPNGTGGSGPTGNDPYPAGPYGWAEGKVAPDVSFEGYVGGKPPWTSIALHDYYDPKGTKGIRALYIPVFAAWCGVCKEESAALPPIVAKYQAKGARFLAMLANADDGGPATKSTVDYWIAQYKFSFDFAVEKTDLGESYFPYHILIDPRTMKVVGADACPADSSMPCIDQLLAKNP